MRRNIYTVLVFPIVCRTYRAESVWISPFDVSEKVERAVQTYSLDEFVKVFLIEEV